MIFNESSSEMYKKFADIEKAAFILSLIIEKPEFVYDVVFKDPFVKKDIFEETNNFELKIVFKDDGAIRKKLREHINTMESGILEQLEQIKKEKKFYE